MSSRETVFLIDDDDGLRRATTRLLQANGFEVQSYASADEYLEKFDSSAAGCLLLDLRMPGTSGLELQQTLAARGAPPPIVFLTGHADVPASVLAMKLGAIDFLEKPVSEQTLVDALLRALELNREQRKSRAEVTVLRERYDVLTPREREVLAEMIAGQLNKQAAYSLGIAERTVKLHRSRVMEKMGADSLPELVRMAGRLGLKPAGE